MSYITIRLRIISDIETKVMERQKNHMHRSDESIQSSAPTGKVQKKHQVMKRRLLECDSLAFHTAEWTTDSSSHYLDSSGEEPDPVGSPRRTLFKLVTVSLINHSPKPVTSFFGGTLYVLDDRCFLFAVSVNYDAWYLPSLALDSPGSGWWVDGCIKHRRFKMTECASVNLWHKDKTLCPQAWS